MVTTTTCTKGSEHWPSPKPPGSVYLLTQNPQPVADGNDDTLWKVANFDPAQNLWALFNFWRRLQTMTQPKTPGLCLFAYPKPPACSWRWRRPLKSTLRKVANFDPAQNRRALHKILTQNPQPVVDGDYDHSGEGGQAGPIVDIAAAPAVGLSVYEEDDWKSRLFFTWAKQRKIRTLL